MAVLRKRGESWEVDYRINGRRIKKVIGRNKRTAELHLKDIEVKIAKDDLGFIKKDTDLKKLFEDFLRLSETDNSPNTYKRYRAILDNFQSFLDRYPYITKISQLNPKFFEDYKHYRKGQRAKGKTLNIELQTLRNMFNKALKWGYCNNNPTEGVALLRTDKNEEPRFLIRDECDKLLKNCGDELYPVFFIFLNTGMRKSELLNLEWRDVDFERKRIRIRVKDGWKPKTRERDIPFNGRVSGVLKMLKGKSEGSLVFTDEHGNKIGKNRLRRRLMRITKKCGFPDVTKLHSLRHTFAARLIMNGAPLPTVQKLMGHSDISTTMIYSHLTPDHISDTIVKKLDF